MPPIAEAPLERLDADLRAWLDGDVAQLQDPYPLFAALRAHAPVRELGPVVVLSRYDDVKVGLREVGRFSSRVFLSERAREAVAAMTPAQRADHDAVAAHDAVSVSHTDDEQHVRLRRIFHRAFTPRRVAEMRATVEAYTDRLLAPFGSGDVVDMRELAYRLPLCIITDLLGVPERDHDMIHEWSLKIGASRGMVEPNVLRDARLAIEEFGAYLTQRTAEIRSGRSAGGTIVEALLDDEEQEHLTPDELTANFVLLLFAGHETTTNLIATGLLSLLEARSQWELLCEDPPTMSPKATEELLRYVSPVQLTQRVAREDLWFGDVPVPEGRHIIMLNGSANRDESVFDRPDELDLEREGPGHLDLGFGPHFCLGAALARLEGQVVLSRLATRWPRMELGKAPGELRWTGNAMLRTLVELPVALGPRRG